MKVAEKMVLIERDSLIGKRITKMDAPEKASGMTRYVHDIDLPGQLYGKILRSARVHARIRRIDTSKAKALPGVHVVITAADVPDQRP
ncbi:MAG TPA: hypothetical protein PK956_10520, partial [Burkholderiaceae bacterium]|nr:hypothetical protein [Burkholderiaceae bacterium]